WRRGPPYSQRARRNARRQRQGQDNGKHSNDADASPDADPQATRLGAPRRLNGYTRFHNAPLALLSQPVLLLLHVFSIAQVDARGCLLTEKGGETGGCSPFSGAFSHTRCVRKARVCSMPNARARSSTMI